MPRPLKPWFHKRKNCWGIEPNGKLIKLADGPKNDDTKKEAQRQLDILKGEWASNVPLDVGKSRLTVLALIEGYLEHHDGKLSDRTFYEWERLLNHFGQFCVDHRPAITLVKDCLPIHLEQFLKANPSWKSRDTLAEVVKVVKRLFAWGEDMGIAPPSPFRRKVSYTFGNSRRPMTDEEFRTLIKACDLKQQRLREIMVFCYSTGARTARWSDLELEQGVIILKEHKTSKTQKVPKPRVIYLTEEVLSLLAAIRRRQPDSEFIFSSRRRRPYHRNSIQQNLRCLREKIGLPDDVKLYGCRHGFGPRAVLRGENMAVLAELMGHAEGSRITAHYVHLADQGQHLKETLRRINQAS